MLIPGSGLPVRQLFPRRRAAWKISKDYIDRCSPLNVKEICCAALVNSDLKQVAASEKHQRLTHRYIVVRLVNSPNNSATRVPFGFASRLTLFE